MQKDQVLFAAVVSFIGGIFAGSFFTLPVAFIFLGLALLVSVGVVFPGRSIRVSTLLFVIFFGGSLLASEAKERVLSWSPPGKVSGEVRIVANPEDRDFSRQVLLIFERCDEGECPQARVLWQAPLSFQGEAGARLSFSCILELPKNFDSEFDYRMFLGKDGIGFLCLKADKAVLLESDVLGRLRRLLYVPKHILEGALGQAISEPEAGLAKGLLLGGSTYLPSSLQDAFTRIGLSHMIAVSGYNITIIAQLLLALGLLLGLWRRQAISFALIGIVLFIIMIGLPASAVRAGAMASIVFIALQLGRLAQPVNALLFAGAVMLLFHPLLLRYDLGFQLSFLATLALLWVAPYQERLQPKNLLLRPVVEILLMTVAVELFVLPIILLSFHTASLLILAGNFLVVLVPIAMALSFVAALLFLLVPALSVFVAWSAYAALSLITRSVEWLGSFGNMSVTVGQFGSSQLILWYGILGISTVCLKYFFLKRPYVAKS